MKEPKTHENKIFAIHYDGKLMGSFKWEGGNYPNLQGWRPPKKIYWSLGMARSGATHLPENFLDKCEIVEYAPVKVVEKLSIASRQKKRIESEIKKEISCLKYQRDSLERHEKDNPQFVKEMEKNIQNREKKIQELQASLKSAS